MKGLDRNSGNGQIAKGFHFIGLRIASLLFADDVVLWGSSCGPLQHAVRWFEAKCEASPMRISNSMSETVVVSWKRVECLAGLGLHPK